MRRVILVLAFVSVIIESAWITLGPPDISGALTFFGGGVPTVFAGQAIMVLIAWIAVIAAVGALLLTVTRAIGRLRLTQQPTTRAGILLVVGLLLLFVSVVQHSLALSSFCCDSSPAAIREAIHLAQ